MKSNLFVPRRVRALVLSMMIGLSFLSPVRSQAGVFCIMVTVLDGTASTAPVIAFGALLGGVVGTGLATKVLGPTVAMVLIGLGKESPSSLRAMNQGLIGQKYPFLRAETIQALASLLESTVAKIPLSEGIQVQDAKTGKSYRQMFVRLPEIEVRDILKMDPELSDEETERVVRDLESSDNA